MASYIVLNPPGVTGKNEKALFIRDGFSFFGLLFPLFYLVWNRLWLAAATLLSVLVAGEIMGTIYNLAIFSLMVDVMAGLYLALEGGQLMASVLKSKGWNEETVISAQDLDDAEVLYFSSEAASANTPVFARLQRETGGPALGLLNPYGGR